MQFSRLDEAQGAREEHSEAYASYIERVPQRATQRFAKSLGSVPGFARKQVKVAGVLQ